MGECQFCDSCTESCGKGTRKRILGKEFDNVCSSSFAFGNPDGDALECVKKLLEMRKRAILEDA